jgi:hypothetical protein
MFNHPAPRPLVVLKLIRTFSHSHAGSDIRVGLSHHNFEGSRIVELMRLVVTGISLHSKAKN